jgi:hypothetical protein
MKGATVETESRALLILGWYANNYATSSRVTSLASKEFWIQCQLQAQILEITNNNGHVGVMITRRQKYS